MSSGIPELELELLDVAQARRRVPEWLAAHVVGAPQGLAAALREVLAGISDEELRATLDELGSNRLTFAFHRANPVCRQLARVWSAALVQPPEVDGIGHFAQAVAEGGPVVVVCNHLSYYDTPATDEVLVREGHDALAQRLVAVAGPKVYGTAFRTCITTMCGTVSAPQSVSVATDGAPNLRELARLARRGVDLAKGLLGEGKVLLLYAEGTRARARRLQPFLYGAARYLDLPGLRVVPLAITGTDAVMPVGSTRLTPGPVSLRFGSALDVAAVGGARPALEAAWGALRGLLPPGYQPTAETPVWR